MSWEQTKIVCKCGASIESRWTSEINDWQSRHDRCLTQPRQPSKPACFADFQFRFADQCECCNVKSECQAKTPGLMLKAGAA